MLMAVLLGTPVVTSPAMSDDGAFPTNPDVPVDPALLDALDKAERYKQKLHGAVKKGKSIEFEKNALREELERALTDLATANTKLRVMREMEAVSVEAAAAAAETPNAAVAELEGELEETRQKLEDTKSALEKSNASLNAAAQATATAKTERDALAKALDESSKALNNSKHSASKRGEADNIVAEARAEDAERRAGEIAAELAAQRVALLSKSRHARSAGGSMPCASGDGLSQARGRAGARGHGGAQADGARRGAAGMGCRRGERGRRRRARRARRRSAPPTPKPSSSVYPLIVRRTGRGWSTRKARTRNVNRHYGKNWMRRYGNDRKSIASMGLAAAATRANYCFRAPSAPRPRRRRREGLLRI